MANQWALIIGINQYQFLQPLCFAQSDAQALWEFLIEEAGWAPNRCLLLTDTSPPVHDRSTYPSQENLIGWVDEWCQKLSSKDQLWVFFSGYGISLDEDDYLMPIEGKPADIPNTGISMYSLLSCLKNRDTSSVLLLLDINRSQSFQGSTPVGQDTLELAQEMGITTILSCQLNQFSQEAASLGHGIFTAALLEGLRYHKDMTLKGLEGYLSERMPELSEHHWRPVQTPLAVIPSPEANNLLPIFQVPKLEVKKGNMDSKIDNQSSDAQNFNSTQAISSASSAQLPNVRIGSQQVALVPYSTGQSDDVAEDTPLWLQTTLWLGGITLVLGMLGGVFLRNQAAFTGQQALKAPVDIRPITPPVSSQFLPSPESPNSNSQLIATPTQAPTQPLQAHQQANQAILDKANSYILPNQASKFTQAIIEARKIKPNEPLYNQAQENITRWSEGILDLAESRAKQGQFDKAIAAARLVPSDNQAIYAKAQQGITRWREQAQQQRSNQILLQAARGLVRSGEASSYNRAITAALKVPQGQPRYGEREQLVAQWSKQIYLISQSRASRGEFKQAVQTATLVPRNTPSYNNAQKAIAKWKQNKK